MPSSSDMKNFPSTKNQRILFLIKEKHMCDASEREFYCTLWPRLQNPFFHYLKQHKESADDVMSNYHPTSIYFLPPQLCIRQSEKKSYSWRHFPEDWYLYIWPNLKSQIFSFFQSYFRKLITDQALFKNIIKLKSRLIIYLNYSSKCIHMHIFLWKKPIRKYHNVMTLSSSTITTIFWCYINMHPQLF